MLIWFYGVLFHFQWFYKEVLSSGWSPFILITCFIIIGAASGAVAKVEKNGRARLVATIMEAQAPRFIGVLACYAAGNNPILRAAAIRSLKRILPEVTDAQEGLFSPEEQKALARLFRADQEAEFFIDLLCVLRDTGDHHALEVVEKLVNNPRQVMSLKTYRFAKEVQTFAAGCLPAIEARAEASRKRSNLLRPSEQPNDNALMRPAGLAPEPPEQLLRAGSMPDSDD
jgi:hypothetical protein